MKKYLKTAAIGLSSSNLLLVAVSLLRAAGMTASFAPADPVVGVTKVAITGNASPRATILDTSTFPDGSLHFFFAHADAAGAYKDGPFTLEQLGTYHDVLKDSVTGESTAISYSGTGDFGVAVDKTAATVKTGGQARFTVTFTSIGGFGGEVVPKIPPESAPPGAAITWSPPLLKLPPNGSATAAVTVLTLIDSQPGVYQLALQGVSGSVTHVVAPAVALTVNPPEPGTITATVSPGRAIVGVNQVRIGGRATAGQLVIDTSTFPDGVTHKFVVHVTGAGTYSDGPFVLRQLGTYHDVLLDGATGATTEITYQGVGDFSASVDRTSQTVARGEEAKFAVTFKSLFGFAGPITPAVPDLARIAGATASWSSAAVTVRSGDSIAAGLTVKTSNETRPGTYKITVQGANGSVTHAAPSEIELTVK